jgi:Ca-activated chloride channel homolog
VTGASDAKFPEIEVEFEVKRPDGTFLLDATRDDIRVTEYDQPVKILSFQAPSTTESMPTTVVLVVDRSLSMEEEDRIGSLKQAVATFLKGLPRGSRVAVVAFGSEVEPICPFTSAAKPVQDAVDALTPAGATRYYDAVASALEMLQKESGRRAVLALTDGEDTFSQSATLDTVIVAARRLGLPVHTLGLGTEDEIESDALRRLATATRGQYYPARQADQLRSIYEQLAERLRSSYSLVYRTDRRLPDGTLRPVRVSYRASKKAGEAKVFIPGMVVPAAGWSPLFLSLVAILATLAILPGQFARRPVRKG